MRQRTRNTDTMQWRHAELAEAARRGPRAKRIVMGDAVSRQGSPCVYIMANAHRTIYTGASSDLYTRMWQHRHHVHPGFTKEHDCTQLVYIAEFSRMDDAIAWEKVVKGKSQAKKSALIEEANPRWNDLAWNRYEE